MNSTIAIIDIGSNSTKCLVAGKCDSVDIEIISDSSTPLRLGANLEKDNYFSYDIIEYAVSKLALIIKALRINGTHKIYAFGTEAFRKAGNSDFFIERIFNETGVRIRVLTADDEARYSYEGCNIKKSNNTLLFDSGGGSTEFVYKKSSNFISQSLPIGAVNITNQFLKSDPVNENDFANVTQHINRQIDTLKLPDNLENIVAQGGSAVTLGQMKTESDSFRPEQVNEMELTKDQIELYINVLKSNSHRARAAIPGLQPDRADIILAGSLIIKAILEVTNKNKLTISANGIRHGILRELILKLN